MATGRQWQSIAEEGRALVERLGGRWGPAGGMCRCPAHDDRNPSLSVRPGRSRLLLHCFAGCTVSDVLAALEAGRLLVPAPGAVEGSSGDRELRPAAAALRIWSAARRVEGTVAELYLKSRGLAAGSPELRFNARTPHGRSPTASFRPALVAAVRDGSGLVAIHRTFVDLDRNGHVGRAERRGLGRFGRGAVRLGGAGSILGLAEGVETAFSASALFGVACWATLGAGRFGEVELPAGVERLLLFLDNDPAGRRAEALSRHAFSGVARIEAHYPPGPGEDWNDVLRAARARRREEAGMGESDRRGDGRAGSDKEIKR